MDGFKVRGAWTLQALAHLTQRTSAISVCQIAPRLGVGNR